MHRTITIVPLFLHQIFTCIAMSFKRDRSCTT